MVESIRLLLVDDHEVVRIGLRALLGKTEIITVVGEAASVAGAIAEAARLRPDVVLMDIRLPDGSGVEACREILAAGSGTRVLFLTSFSDDDAVRVAVCGGASGYLLKEIGGDALVNAVKTVAAGQSILDPAVARPVIEQLRSFGTRPADSKHEALSPQERRVLGFVAEGKTNKEVAAIMGLSDKTVKNYLSTIFQKLHISHRSQAAVYFAQHSQS